MQGIMSISKLPDILDTRIFYTNLFESFKGSFYHLLLYHYLLNPLTIHGRLKGDARVI